MIGCVGMCVVVNDFICLLVLVSLGAASPPPFGLGLSDDDLPRYVLYM